MKMINCHTCGRFTGYYIGSLQVMRYCSKCCQTFNKDTFRKLAEKYRNQFVNSSGPATLYLSAEAVETIRNWGNEI